MIVLLFLLISLMVPTALTSFCGDGAVPFRLEHLPSGGLSLGCAVPSCFGGEEGGAHTHNHENSRFDPSQETDNKKDGFIRQSDAKRPNFRHEKAPSQKAVCEKVASSSACGGELQWVGGIGKTRNGRRLTLLCCTYHGLKFSSEIGQPTIEANEAFVGGEVLHNGRQTAFDVITNVKKLTGPNGIPQYQVTVRRMPCLPDLAEPINKVDGAVTQEIDGILKSQEPPLPQPQPFQPLLQPFQQPVFVPQAPQVFAQAVAPPPVAAGGVQSAAAVAPYGYGSNVACFSGDTIVTTTLGQKRMDEVRIGDVILSGYENVPVFVPVVSFIHRLPTKTVRFLRIETNDAATVKITPQHLIFAIKEGKSDGHFVLARDVAIGDLLIRINEEQSSFISLPITNISVVFEKGAFAPMTSNAGIVTNGILASCHSVTNKIDLQHSFIYWMRCTEMFMWQMFDDQKTANSDRGIVEVPSGINLLLSMLEYIIPSAPFTSW